MKWFSRFFSDNADNASGELNAFLGAGTHFTGQLEFTGSVRIDGRFQGVITSPGTLILGHEAVVKGEIRVANLNSNGCIIGTVVAERGAHLHEHALFDGRIVTPRLSMDEGAVLNGSIEMPRGDKTLAVDDLAELEGDSVPVLPTASVKPAVAGAAMSAATMSAAAMSDSRDEDPEGDGD